MQIFERIGEIIKYFANNSQAQFARSLGVLPTTFNGYMNEEGQERIRFSLLKKILEIYPDVSREWLLFGDGKMLKTGTDSDPEKEKLQAKIADLEAELRETNRLYRNLSARYFIDGVGDKPDVPNTGKTGNGA